MKILALLLLLCPATWAAGPMAAPAAPAIHGKALSDECATCGKRIYFGERCLTCIAKEVKRNRSHPCADCDESILIGTRCAACTWAATREYLAHDCAGCDEEILFGSLCSSCAAVSLEESLRGLYARGAELGPEVLAELEQLLPGADDPEAWEVTKKQERAAWERALEHYASSAAEYAQETGREVWDGLEDLELQRRAAQVAGAAVEVAKLVEGGKRRLAQTGVRSAGRLPVHSELGWTTLEDLARFKLIQTAPALEGTDLVEDPAAVIASLIVADHLYFLMDLQLVPTPAGPVSIVAALEEKSGKDAAGTLACLTILRSVRDIKRGEDLTRSLRDISRSLRVLNPEFEDPEEGALDGEPAPELPAEDG